MWGAMETSEASSWPDERVRNVFYAAVLCSFGMSSYVYDEFKKRYKKLVYHSEISESKSKDTISIETWEKWLEKTIHEK